MPIFYWQVHLRLERPLQGAKCHSRRQDRGDPRHGWGECSIELEEEEKAMETPPRESERRVCSLVRMCSSRTFLGSHAKRSVHWVLLLQKGYTYIMPQKPVHLPRVFLKLQETQSREMKTLGQDNTNILEMNVSVGAPAL